MKSLSISKMVPFLDKEDTNELVEMILQSETGEYKGVTLGNVLPFLREEKIENLFHSFLEQGKNVSILYPFLSDKKLHEITAEYLNGTLDIDMNGLYPFLPSEDIKTLFRMAMDKE